MPFETNATYCTLVYLKTRGIHGLASAGACSIRYSLFFFVRFAMKSSVGDLLCSIIGGSELSYTSSTCARLKIRIYSHKLGIVGVSTLAIRE